MQDFMPVIVLTVVGFFALAALLLIPVWKFLNKEEETAEKWDRYHDSDVTRPGK